MIPPAVKPITRYIAAYDTEAPVNCLRACHTIRTVHERFGFPATFFITGQRLEEEGAGFRDVLGSCSLFEIASHTYSHRPLRDHPFCGTAPAREERIQEIRLGKQWVEDIFDRECLGMRPGCGFSDALRGDPWLQEQVSSAGFRYISSLLWGPQTTLPALLESPFNYGPEGFPDLWELPAHGWHENALKAHNLTDQIQRLLAWPMPRPDLVPPAPVHSPEEEFAVNKLFIEAAIAAGLPYVTLIWHPWSLGRFDPQMRMLDLTFTYVRELGLEAATFHDEWQRLAGL
jgi:peptidoglycan/xylan/chitin deacetylase (PgdA/CDA1 family)